MRETALRERDGERETERERGGERQREMMMMIHGS